jgi:hypothetical protein
MGQSFRVFCVAGGPRVDSIRRLLQSGRRRFQERGLASKTSKVAFLGSNTLVWGRLSPTGRRCPSSLTASAFLQVNDITLFYQFNV